jgi:IS5 family transposase
MRIKQDTQGVLWFQRPTLALTAEHYARYEGIDRILREEPALVELVHRDLKAALERENKQRNRRCQYTSDNALRILICKTIEADTFRGITVRIDDSNFLRWFTRIHDKDMMEFTTLNKLANCIRPETWKRINEHLGRHAVENELIEGEKLRLDTTAVETNIHWPTDSGLLWDVYRVLARLIEQARELDSSVVGNRRLRARRAKRLCIGIQRQARRRAASSRNLRRPYQALIRLVEAILAWANEVADGLACKGRKYGVKAHAVSDSLVDQLRHFARLGAQVVDQTRRRVLCGEAVPNDEKLFSLFEPHTELIKRGKVGKPIEFGHMVLFQQVAGSFITDYRVFEKKPVEHELIDQAVKSHTKLFGKPPEVLTADKGFYESMSKIRELEQQIGLVAIGKIGGRTEAEKERESNILFKLAQKFRAGIEGSFSFVKRCLRLLRCFNKGFTHYEATVGLTVLAHNLLVLARDTS